LEKNPKKIEDNYIDMDFLYKGVETKTEPGLYDVGWGSCETIEVFRDRAASQEGCEMEDREKTNALLIEELEELRREVPGLRARATERASAMERVQEERDRAQNYLNIAGVMIVVIGSDHRVRLINRKGCEILGYEEKEIVGKDWFDNFLPEGLRDQVKNVFNKLMDGQIDPVEYFENPVLTSSGEERTIAWHNTFLRDGEEKIYATLSSGEDITDRKRAERELANEKERLDVTLRSIGDGVIATDDEGRIVVINKVGEELTGWSRDECIGKPLEDVFQIVYKDTRERCLNPYKEVLERGMIMGLANDVVLISRDGAERIIADSGAPILDVNDDIIGVVIVFRDITEKRKMEEELSRIQKLESIGVLAGGIAHDFNNILTSILGNITLAKSQVEVGGKVFEILSEGEKAALVAKDLTQKLLTFAVGGVPIRKTTSIVGLVKDSCKLALTGSNVDCEFSMPTNLWAVDIDKGQMGQVFSNLIINAYQAMPDGGTIRVNTENILVTPKDVLPIPEGKYVKIAIGDHGIGIPEEYQSKVFDPFFTTKQKGRGLGLAVCYSIIRSHHGYITHESKLGDGTVFYIYLPASEDQVQVDEGASREPIAGSGKILFMDDEENVRYVAGRMLERIGYDVVFAKEGNKAVELYNEALSSEEPFDAVILDLTVTGAPGGKKTILKLLEMDPKVKAIVSSGYSNDPIMADYSNYGFRCVVAKPYTIRDLSEVLHKVIKCVDK
jgi:PAS domain S-box-containing protein